MTDTVPLVFKDVHAHVDASLGLGLEVAFAKFGEEMRKSGCQRAVALHLLTQPWSAEEWCRTALAVPGVKPFVSIDLGSREAHDELRFLVAERGACGLKLHPRLYGIPVSDSRTTDIVRLAGTLGIPVLIDAFFDWALLSQGTEAAHFGQLAERSPDTRICVAHMAAPHVTTALMMARAIPNLFLDVSFSCLYYRGSSVTMDICYGVRSLRGRKIMYGSDYPDRPMLETIEDTIVEFTKAEVSMELQQRVLLDNFSIFMGSSE